MSESSIHQMPACDGCKASTKDTWETLTTVPPYGRLCAKCREIALAILHAAQLIGALPLQKGAPK